jgi:hypothetical protein
LKIKIPKAYLTRCFDDAKNDNGANEGKNMEA